MDTPGIRYLLILSVFTVQIIAFSALFLGDSAFAQQAELSGAVNQQDPAPVTVGQNAGCSTTEFCSPRNQAQTSLPDAPSSSRIADSKSSPLTLGERFRIYSHTLVRPYTLVGPAFGAGIGQWEDEPPEWGQGGEGYGRRFASGMGRHVIAETIRFGVAAADGEDPRYKRSQQSGIWDRTRHVLVETFTSETGNGTRIPAYSRFAGTYGAAFISNAWYPDSRADVGHALRRGSSAIGSSLAFHMFEEFVPRKYFKALHIPD